MTALLYTVIVLFTLVSLIMVLLILIQKGRGGGLASAFGGMGGNTAFGAKTGDVLTWATSIVFGVFLILAIALNLVATSVHAQRQQLPGAQSSAQSSQSDTPAPAQGSSSDLPFAPVQAPPATQP